MDSAARERRRDSVGANPPFVVHNSRSGVDLCLEAVGRDKSGRTVAVVAAPCNSSSPSQQWRSANPLPAPSEETTPIAASSGGDIISNNNDDDATQASSSKAMLIFTGAQDPRDPAARCLEVSTTSYSLGPGLLLGECAQPRMLNKAVQWSIDNTSLVSHGGACCGDIFATHPVCAAVDNEPTCADLLLLQSGGREAQWCNTSLPAEARTKALLAAMTLQEKATNLDSHNFGVPRLAVPPNIFSEALHGMCAGCGASVQFPGEYESTGCPTSFPQVISMGASWNRTLWTAVGNLVSDEARGLYVDDVCGV